MLKSDFFQHLDEQGRYIRGMDILSSTQALKEPRLRIM